jgi:glycosyltransferase involved in cell wall biosynthesis
MTAGLPFLMDVSRLTGRRMRGRLPTGVDRLALAYVRRYGPRSRAFVRDGRFHLVLPDALSQSLFRLLLSPPPDFTARAWRLIACGAAARNRRRDPGGSVFFNIGHSGLEYRRYPDLLGRMKVKPVFYVHDLIPITHPEYCRPGERDRHRVRMRMVLGLARGVVTNSRATLEELSRYAAGTGMELPPSVPAYPAPPEFGAAAAKRPVDRPYFVIVGTIEPRKNHVLLLQAWRRIAAEMGDGAPLLAVIGQRGWECENAVDLLERCDALKGRVLELSSCSDTEMAAWLRHAQALLFPSFTEGFGMPLMEALACGTPVIASDLPVFREIAGDIPEYLDPLDGAGWIAAIREYCADDGPRRSRQVRDMAGYSVPSWADHFARVDALLEQVTG